MSEAVPISFANGSRVDRLIAESNHRIANHLALLAGTVQTRRMALSRGPEALSRDQVGEMLEEIAAKIASVAHLHRTLARPRQARKVELGKYLAESCSVVISTLGVGGRLRVLYMLEAGCDVTAEQAQSLALIVNELLMNALKYAHPSGVPVELRLACRSEPDGQVILDVEDDGVGLPEGFDVARDGGLGFTLIRTLVNSLAGSFSANSDSLGTSFRFVFGGIRCARAAAGTASPSVLALSSN
jgi:two-component sensor histidine kinase